MRSGYAITPATGARADELIAQHHKLLSAKEQRTAPIVRTLEKKYNQIDETLAGARISRKCRNAPASQLWITNPQCGKSIGSFQ